MSKPQNPMVQEIESYFKKQNLVALATTDGDQPRVRIVSMIRLNDEFYVITGSRGGVDTAKVRQIRKNPKVEFVMQVERGGETGNIRVESTAHIVNDYVQKAMLFQEVGWAKDYFSSPEDPSYVLLRLRVRSYEYSVPGRPKPGQPKVIKVEVS